METTNIGANGEMPDASTSAPATGETQGTGETSGTTKPASLDDAVSQIESLRAALKKANSESASHRHKAKELDDLKAKTENESLTTQQRLEKQLAELQKSHDETSKRYRDRVSNYEVRLQAAEMGIIDPDAAAQLIQSRIEYEEDGSPKNVADLLKDLAKNKPYLVGKQQVSTSGGATNPSRAQTNNTGELTWRAISAMDQAQYNSRRFEIQQWMAKNPRR